MLFWNFDTPICDNTSDVRTDKVDSGNTDWRYDTRNIPESWMSDKDTIILLQNCISELEASEFSQSELDNLCNNFVNIIQHMSTTNTSSCQI